MGAAPAEALARINLLTAFADGLLDRRAHTRCTGAGAGIDRRLQKDRRRDDPWRHANFCERPQI